MMVRTYQAGGRTLAVAAVFAAAIGLAGSCSAAGEHSGKAVDTSRIVSVGGDVTEILYALGLEDKIVAVDTTSQFPPEALKDKKSVGYMRALSSEGVLALNPSAIIASESAGPPEVARALKSSSIAYVEIPDETSAEGVASKINMIAEAVAADTEGNELIKRVKDGFASLADSREKVIKRARVLFVLSAQNGRALVGGSGTSADAILKLAGADNAAASVTGFKPLVDEAVIELAPDVILLMRRGDGNDGHDDILSLKGVQSTPAGRSKRIVVMDGSYLLGFGPRTPAAARELMTALYPDLSLEVGDPQARGN